MAKARGTAASDGIVLASIDAKVVKELLEDASVVCSFPLEVAVFGGKAVIDPLELEGMARGQCVHAGGGFGLCGTEALCDFGFLGTIKGRLGGVKLDPGVGAHQCVQPSLFVEERRGPVEGNRDGLQISLEAAHLLPLLGNKSRSPIVIPLCQSSMSMFGSGVKLGQHLCFQRVERIQIGRLCLCQVCSQL